MMLASSATHSSTSLKCLLCDMIYSATVDSYLPPPRNPHNQTAITVVNRFAADLAARFSPIVGCTRSWDTADPTDFEVIIDNMMNLEVLFVSASLTGNNTLREIAVSHANKTMQNQIRPDGSSFHVVEYNATTGAVIARFTAQGYANYRWNSIFFPYGCISQELHTVHGAEGKRGGSMDFLIVSAQFLCIQNEPIATFIVYKHTQHLDYLNTARHMASYFLTNLPSNGVVPWDFNAPLEPSRPADSSAAMIAVNGLFLLSQQERSLSPPNMTGSAYYINAAIQLLQNNTDLAWRPAWQSLLANGTVDNPEGNNMTGIVYGDYFFVKAGNELISMGLVSCL
ncbi:hypothetical protein AcV5_005683 [Taiwanofungus camphoratus]|nr:hypothetical protein AcV5_005683 [Antrodia cinnamomea]